MAKTKPPKPIPLDLDPSLVPSYSFNAYVYDLYDGDTIFYHADLGYRQWAMFQAGRLLGINAPEIQAKAKKVRAAAQDSKRGLLEMMASYALNRVTTAKLATPRDLTTTDLGPSGVYGYQLQIRSLKAPVSRSPGFFDAKKEKYGRWLVVVVGADDAGKPVILNDLMVKKNLAQPYMVDGTTPATTKQLLRDPELLQRYLRTLSRRTKR